MRRLASGLVALGLFLGACSGGEDGSEPAATRLRVDQIDEAVAALEAARGGPQRYTEINAIPEGVNLFVVGPEGEELAYLFVDGRLEPPEAPSVSSGTPFGLEGVSIGIAPELVRRTVERFEGAEIVSLALVDLPETGVVWALRSRSRRGGLLNVLYRPDGSLISVAPA